MSRYKKTINVLDFERTAHVINFNIISFFFRTLDSNHVKVVRVVNTKLGFPD